MGWLKRIKVVLEEEPETWLAYIYGQQFENLRHLRDSEPKYKGWYFRLAIWLYILLRSVKINPRSLRVECEYLVFAGTINQKNSLKSTLSELKKRDVSVCAIAPKKILSQKEIENKEYETMAYSYLAVMKSIFLCSLRAKRLRDLLQGKNKLLTKNRLDTFLNVYDALVYFDTLLTKVKPKTVIVSNDHNTLNRALLALARHAGIKTVYMQHASVSNLFPALNVDYAFLDGQSALETYRQCENNCPVTSPLIKNRKVFLTGQKKELVTDLPRAEGLLTVGVALNALDSLAGIKTLINNLRNNNLKVRLRWHPGFSSRKVRDLKRTLSDYEVDFSDPKTESLGDFFSNIRCMIAGNSSIHLEAALCHVLPIDYEIGKQNVDDYYGYVRNGVSVEAKTTNNLIECIRRVESGELIVNKAAARFYSSTIGTPWEGREGHLVAETLISLRTNSNTPILSINL